MPKIEIDFTRFLSLCLVLMLIVGVLATVSVFAEGGQTGKAEEGTSGGSDEIVEEAPDYYFYNADALNSLQNYGPRTSLSMVEDDLGFNALRMTVGGSGDDPYQVFFVPDEVSIKEYSFVAFFVKKPTTATGFQAFFKAKDAEQFTEKESVKSKYQANNKWQILVFELSELNIASDLDQFRMDYHPGGPSAVGEYCDVAGVSFGTTEDAAMRPICDLLGESQSVVYHFSDFSAEEADYVCESYLYTEAGISNGNIIYRAVGKGDANADDTQSMWNIEKHLKYLGHPILDAGDFGYIVIKYKAHIKDGIEQRFEIFYQTNGRTNAVWMCSAYDKYKASNEWQGIQFKFEGGNEWTGTVHSLRIDWSDNIPIDSQGVMKISDVYFVKDSKSAAAINKIMNNIIVTRTGADPDMTEETTVEITESPSGTETIGIITDEPVSEETTVETSEETLPEFIETTEESKSTEATTEDVTEAPSEGESDEITEDVADKNEQKPPKQDTSEDNSDLLGGGEEQKGSEMPFYIACACLATLSVLSIATVVVIRIRNR